MMRQSLSRNQRSKGGFRLKHVLQICLLLAICTWLLYQVKHSHDKKRAFEERITKISRKATEKQSNLFNFGRKGLPLVKDNDSTGMSRAKDEDVEEGQGVEGEEERDVKHDENEDEEVKKDGDDGVNELDQDRGDDENEQEEEEQFMDEDGKDGQVEEDALFDNEEREDSAQEAREENYKRDDASSAVAHDVHAVDEVGRGLDGEQGIEDSKVDDIGIAVNRTVDDSNNSKNSTLYYLASMSNASNAAFGENMTAANADFSTNGSHSDLKGPEVEFTKVENGSIATPLSTEGSSLNESQPNKTIATLPEITAMATVNLTDSPPEYQNSSKLDDSLSTREIPQRESSGFTPVQDQNNPVNEISREGPVEPDMKSYTSEEHKSEIHPQNVTTSKNEETAQTEPDSLSHNAVTAEQSETHTKLPTLPVMKDDDKHAEDKAGE